MSTDFHPAARRPLASQVADQIRRGITNGDLRPGMRIESSRKLARELGVSLPVVREALAALAYLGMIEVRHGVGVFIARRRVAARSLKLAHRRANRTELHQLRATVAAETAARAANRRQTARQQLDLHMLLQERRRSILAGEPGDFVQADLALHDFVAGIAGSPLHAALERMTGIGLVGDMTGSAGRLAMDDELDELHDALVEAIDASDADAARAAAVAIATAEGAAPD
jgi:DNA-binding FadR family transcriptional regulator